MVIATAGAEGRYLPTGESEVVQHFPALPLPGPAVDSNGAGDAFVSGFLHGWLTGLSYPDSACTVIGVP